MIPGEGRENCSGQGKGHALTGQSDPEWGCYWVHSLWTYGGSQWGRVNWRRKVESLEPHHKEASRQPGLTCWDHDTIITTTNHHAAFWTERSHSAIKVKCSCQSHVELFDCQAHSLQQNLWSPGQKMNPGLITSVQRKWVHILTVHTVGNVLAFQIKNSLQDFISFSVRMHTVHKQLRGPLGVNSLSTLWVLGNQSYWDWWKVLESAFTWQTISLACF